MSKLYSKYVVFEETLTKILLVIIIALVFYAAVVRWIGFPLPWSVEMAQLFYAWFAFLAAAQALRRKAHIGVDFITRRFPNKIQNITTIIEYIIICMFLLFMIYSSIQLSINNAVRQLNALPISYSFITISIAFGCFSMLITSILHIISLIKGEDIKGSATNGLKA